MFLKAIKGILNPHGIQKVWVLTTMPWLLMFTTGYWISTQLLCACFPGKILTCFMMLLWHGNAFQITGPFVRGPTGDGSQRAVDKDTLYCHGWTAEQPVKQTASWRWFEMMLWRLCDVPVMLSTLLSMPFVFRDRFNWHWWPILIISKFIKMITQKYGCTCLATWPEMVPHV